MAPLVGEFPFVKGWYRLGLLLRQCEDELRSTLEDWILVGLKLEHPLPIIDKIDLNKEPIHEPMDSV